MDQVDEKQKDNNSGSVNRYKCLKLLGEGSFGKAYLVQCADQTFAVVKIVLLDNMTEEEQKDSFLESKILEKLDHPNIIKIKEVYITRKPRLSLCIVMDYADGGDLQGKIKQQRGKYFTEAQILDWFTQICLAIKHIHDRKILHRDLKSQNIFLTLNGLIKLGDFGIAKCLKNTVEKAKTVVGTPYYLSPEIVQNKPYSFKSDIWSLGILLYEMCALKMPFDASNLASLSLKIVKGSYNPLPTVYTRDLRGLVALMLNTDMNKRPSINEILRQSIIKSRIKNFLNELEYDREFSHTIIHKYNVLTGPKVQKSHEAYNTENIQKKIETKPNCIVPNIQVAKVNNPNNYISNNNLIPSENVGKVPCNQVKIDIKDYISVQNKNHKPNPIRRDQLNPNFRKVNEAPDGSGNINNNALKIEIFEPKKKPQKSVDRVLITNNLQHINNESKLSANVLPQQNLEKQKINKVKPTAKSIEKVEPPSKKENELRILIKEMREKKKKVQGKNEIVVEWMGLTKYNQSEESKDSKGDEDELTIVEKKNKMEDYVNTHKMLMEMDKLDKEDKSKIDSEETLEDENKLKQEFMNLRIEDVARNENIEENFQFKKKEEEDESNTDYSALECIKISLEKDLGDMLFASLYQIIETNTDFEAKKFDNSLITKVKEEMFLIHDAESIELALSKVTEVFDLVVKERRASINANYR